MNPQRLIDESRRVVADWSAMPLQGRVVLGALTGIVALVGLVVVITILSWWFASTREILFNNPLIARFAGFIETEERMTEALSNFEAVMPQFLYEANQEAGRAGALLQQQARQMAVSSDLVVSGSEVLEPEQLEDMIAYRVELNVAGKPGGIEEMLKKLNRASPAIFVERLELTAQKRVVRRRANSNNPELDEGVVARVALMAYGIPSS